MVALSTTGVAGKSAWPQKSLSLSRVDAWLLCKVFVGGRPSVGMFDVTEMDIKNESFQWAIIAITGSGVDVDMRMRAQSIRR